jgi:endo-1,4-beta-D-glucanase Y
VILVSAIEGFDNAGGMTFNPSYYVFPVIRTFAKELPDPVWQRVWNDGLNLLTSACFGPFGPWELTPDWGYLTRSSNMPRHRPGRTWRALRPPRTT